MFIWILNMFRATMCSSSGGQLYEYNFWYNHSVLVAVRYLGQDGTPSWPTFRAATNTEWLYQKLYSYNCPPEDEHIVAGKHVEDSNKHIIEETVRQVDYLPEEMRIIVYQCNWVSIWCCEMTWVFVNLVFKKKNVTTSKYKIRSLFWLRTYFHMALGFISI